MANLTVKELEQLLKREPFKFISLTDSEGDTIVAFNTPRINVDRRKKEIIDKLNSTILPDGVYYLRYKESIANEGVKSYCITKGRGVTAPIVSQAPEIVKVKEVITMKEESVLSYSAALAMQQQISDLKVENATLKNQIEQLNQLLDEYEEEGMGEKSEEMISESTFNMLDRLTDKFTPMIDKYFDQRDTEVEALKQIALAKSSPAQQQRPSASPKTQQQYKPPTPIPTPGTVTTVFTPGSPSPSPGAAPPSDAPQPKEEDKEMIQVLSVMKFEDLKNGYEKLKAAGDFDNIKTFVRIMNQIRPDELRQIIAEDVK